MSVPFQHLSGTSKRSCSRNFFLGAFETIATANVDADATFLCNESTLRWQKSEIPSERSSIGDIEISRNEHVMLALKRHYGDANDNLWSQRLKMRTVQFVIGSSMETKPTTLVHWGLCFLHFPQVRRFTIPYPRRVTAHQVVFRDRLTFLASYFWRLIWQEWQEEIISTVRQANADDI